MSYWVDNPQAHSVKLGLRYVNLLKLSKDQDLDHGYLSRIFSGKRAASARYLRRIAVALGISTDDLLQLLDEKARQAA